MDMNNFENNINAFIGVFKQFLLVPFLVIFGTLSRVTWEYFHNKKKPTAKQIFGIATMSVFTSVLIYLVLRGLNFNPYIINASVLFAGFAGHNVILYVMENQEDIIERVLTRLGLKKVKNEDNV